MVSAPVRLILWSTLAAAVATFCIVQDRVTAAGARRYVALQREALAGRGSVVTIDEVMRPAVAQSVRKALLSSGAVAALGVALGLTVGRRRGHGRSTPGPPDA